MEEKIKNAILLPILRTIMDQIKLPNSKCVLHEITIGNKSIFLNDDDVIILYQTIIDMEKQQN